MLVHYNIGPLYLNSFIDSSVIPKTQVSDVRFLECYQFDVNFTESTTARPSFRTTLTQPSQMGNFRHQSTRTNDREKDTDKEKDRDRDTKDGLRSVRPAFS